MQCTNEASKNIPKKYVSHLFLHGNLYVPCFLFFFSAMLLFFTPFCQAKSPINHSQPLHEKRSHTIDSATQRYTIHIEYPSVGVEAIDNKIALWALHQAEMFAIGLDEIPPQDTSKFSLAITFELIPVSPQVFSVVFYITTETGNISKELGLATVSYDLKQEKDLSFSDIFDTTYNLLPFLSQYCTKVLNSAAPAQTTPLMPAGAEPYPENFSLFALTPKGIMIYFPPGQIFPESYGLQKVHIPLEAFSAFKPKLSLWSNKSSLNQQVDF